ncbi:AGE family epimerase/isomerase [Gilvimarinus polysaccharolyticus]|uniref:AGE family epimerase/isomerase n=1 Tax=Gilvimarinus polysaccharolyticus TaxID=863921 RepID=UPI000AE62706|nr:AGE family epimerase/isomerase [Gilvimarinus polysaccharolyticus]
MSQTVGTHNETHMAVSPDRDTAVHSALAKVFNKQLDDIAQWWLSYAQDQAQGGFYGEVSDDNIARTDADKGIVLNTRILWFFSEAAVFTGNMDYRAIADRAYQYLCEYFFDREYGGFYWSLSPGGEVEQSKKQVYAQAFSIYALSAYYELSKNSSALKMALDCFTLIEENCIDTEGEGYYEAYTREWGKIEDVRLSEKDLNYPKTMNTHLHVLEAYTKLYQVHPDKKVAQALAYGIDLFDKYMIDHDSYHLHMFLDDSWQDHSPGITYGHDIECSWLLCKALKVLDDPSRNERLLPVIIKLAKTCQREAIGEHGEVIDAYSWVTESYHEERVWWVQAEALVGFLSAYKLSGDESFLNTAQDIWSFIDTYQIDHDKGEWRWRSTLDAPDGSRNYKAGFWKGPYHNGRAMIEAAKLLGG